MQNKKYIIRFVAILLMIFISSGTFAAGNRYNKKNYRQSSKYGYSKSRCSKNNTKNQNKKTTRNTKKDNYSKKKADNSTAKSESTNNENSITITLSDDLIRHIKIEREKEIGDSIKKELEKELRKELEVRIADSLTKYRKEIIQYKSVTKHDTIIEVQKIERIVKDTVTTRCDSLYGKAIIHENVLQLNFSYGKINDLYLSPLIYRGFAAGIENEWWQNLRKNSNFGHVGNINLKAGSYWNHNYSNSINTISINGGWGFYSNYRHKNLRMLIGPYIELNSFIKNISNNVNKPVSVDLGADLKIMGSIGFAFAAKKTSYRIKYTAFINLIGAQFIPEYWESYYEISKNIKHDIGFSYLGNRINLRHELTFDFQFPHSTWRIGARHEYLKYGNNDILISNENYSIVVATIFNYSINGKVQLKR